MTDDDARKELQRWRYNCAALEQRIAELVVEQLRLRSVLSGVRQTAAEARIWLDLIPYDPRKDMHSTLATIVEIISTELGD